MLGVNVRLCSVPFVVLFTLPFGKEKGVIRRGGGNGNYVRPLLLLRATVVQSS